VNLAAMTSGQMGTGEVGPDFAWLGARSHALHCIVFAAVDQAAYGGSGEETEQLDLLVQSSCRSLEDMVGATLQRLAKRDGGGGCARYQLQRARSAQDALLKVCLQKTLAVLAPAVVPAFEGIDQRTENSAPVVFGGFHRKDSVMFADDFSPGYDLANDS
jgi:hypothetical protein